jgi:hypothetical protein
MKKQILKILIEQKGNWAYPEYIRCINGCPFSKLQDRIPSNNYKLAKREMKLELLKDL